MKEKENLKKRLGEMEKKWGKEKEEMERKWREEKEKMGRELKVNAEAEQTL